jgi:ribonuclease Z
MKLAKGVDIFVTEVQPDTANLQSMKMGMPTVIMTTTIDQAHTPHYAAGYMFNQVQPRLAMVTHTSYDEELIPEITAGIRAHYSGLFQFGAPDVVVVNVTKDAVWSRKAALPDGGNMTRPSPADAVELFDLSPANLKVTFPNARRQLADLVEADVLAGDIDPKKYYPPDVYRVPNKDYPKDFTVDVREIALVKAKQAQTKLSEKAAKIQAVIEAIEGSK